LAALGGSALSRGAGDDAAQRFNEALSLDAHHLASLEGLVDVATKRGDFAEAEALLKDAATHNAANADLNAQLYRKLATVAEEQNRPDDAFSALVQADRSKPGDLRTRMLMGENRYRVNRYREAAQYLTQLAHHPEAHDFAKEASQAVYHAALSELKLRRPD